MATGTLKMKSDTGWLILNSTYGTRYRCVNGVVYLYCRYNGNIPGGTELGTLPEQYRPFDVVIFPNYNIGEFSDAITMSVSYTGKVIITGTGNKWINISGSYPV